MTADRSIQILTTGLRAAHGRMLSDKGMRRPEYTRDLHKLYSRLEDALFETLGAIDAKKYARAKEYAAGVIVIASEMIEYAELLEKAAGESWDAEG